jgi:hypothetical protein
VLDDTVSPINRLTELVTVMLYFPTSASREQTTFVPDSEMKSTGGVTYKMYAKSLVEQRLAAT